jgi:Holliday junction resolvasome RuvABC endonuclease subunit
MRLHSNARFLQLKEVPAQGLGSKRKSRAADFFQYFTQSPLYVYVCARVGEGNHLPYEIYEILKEHRFSRVLNVLRPDFFQVGGLTLVKEVPGEAIAGQRPLTRPRDPGPGETAALNRLPHRPGRSIEEEVVMDQSLHIVATPARAAGHLNRSILALDLGTTTGWAMRTAGGQILSGTNDFRPRRFEGGGMRYVRFTDHLVELAMSAHGIGRVVFEEVRRHAGTDAAHVYGGFLATLTAWCEEYEVPYQGVPVGTIKRHVTGKGNADKAAMIAAVRARGYHPADDNEADAIALLLWAIETDGGTR